MQWRDRLRAESEQLKLAKANNLKVLVGGAIPREHSAHK